MFAHTNNYANTHTHARSCDVRHAIVMWRRLSRCACALADLNNRANKFARVVRVDCLPHKAHTRARFQHTSKTIRLSVMPMFENVCVCVYVCCARVFVHACQRCIIRCIAHAQVNSRYVYHAVLKRPAFRKIYALT